jgi:hypothetical protein
MLSHKYQKIRAGHSNNSTLATLGKRNEKARKKNKTLRNMQKPFRHKKCMFMKGIGGLTSVEEPRNIGD